MVSMCGTFFRKDLQIGLRNDDDDAEHKAEAQNQLQIAGLGQPCTDAVADEGHGVFHTVGEQTQPHDEQHRTDDKGQHQVGGYRCDRKAQQQDDEHDGQDGGDTLSQFFV